MMFGQSSSARKRMHEASTEQEVREAVAAGCSVDALGLHADTPLMRAALRGDTTIVRTLLELGAKPNERNRFWQTALWFACDGGHDQVVDILLRIPDIDIECFSEFESSPLMLASSMGRIDLVDLLLQRGADVDGCPESGCTALMWASSCGQIDAVDRLLEHGANVNAATFEGRTALMDACEGGHLPVVDRLVVHGADFRVITSRGLSALMIAAQGGHADVLSRLISLGADVDAVDDSLQTALMFGCSVNAKDVVKLLLEANANVEMKRFDGKTALDLTVSEEIRSMIRGFSSSSFSSSSQEPHI